MFDGFYKGKRVLVTGDTGFKGAWLCEWLLGLGVEVYGIALPPEGSPSLFEQLNLSQRIQHHNLDIRDYDAVCRIVEEVKPDVVFHMAAQSLVRLSYDKPVETYEVNLMGTVHVLNALRQLKQTCAAVFITTDKCYRNREWVYGYREEDPIGGHDPYSSSKGACELAIDSFRKSYFSDPQACGIGVASARAGNVIGGGDWALDRIVPDCMRALSRDERIPVRNPYATRPWQHVLEPLGGYLRLAECIYRGFDTHRPAHVPLRVLCSAFNFGPALQSNQTVRTLVEEVLQNWPGADWDDLSQVQNQVHEASLLHLSSDKAFHLLGWSSRWDFKETIKATVHWYRSACETSFDPQAFMTDQIKSYSACLES